MQQTIYSIDIDENSESSILYISLYIYIIIYSYPSHIHVLKVCPETRHEDTEYSRGTDEALARTYVWPALTSIKASHIISV